MKDLFFLDLPRLEIFPKSARAGERDTEFEFSLRGSEIMSIN
jgi:hypothetical protein